MKFLVIRFSSIGDATQALSIPQHIKNTYPNASVDFLTKKEFEKIFVFSPSIHKLWLLEKNTGFWSLIKLARQLSNENYTHLYDAHNNLRSNLFLFFCHCTKQASTTYEALEKIFIIEF